MKIKIVVAALSLALVASLMACAAFAYMWIDRSITLTYVKAGCDLESASRQDLERLLSAAWMGMSESMILDRLHAEMARHPAEHSFVKREDDGISFNQIQFNFEQGKLTSVGNN
ncbi:Imm58 family immunity protein [Pseudomonadota bacterium AL_CKDN230030165-1A_HGKHYDSX7]